MPDRVLDASASAHPTSARPIGALVVTNFSIILSLSFCHLVKVTNFIRASEAGGP